MCGFAGIISWDNRYRVHRSVLEQMSARLAHRGPDGQGLWINHDDQVTADHPQAGLVHRRLAIIDLDPRANQPFSDGQGRHLAFNGEIYNYRELRKELEPLLPSYAWRTQSDTEVLLAAYAAWGDRCVEKLNGMFAFAIWDDNKRELFLARDRMGQKPLYYAITPRLAACPKGRDPTTSPSPTDPQSPPVHNIAFGSELPAILATDPTLDTRNDRALEHYLALGYSGLCETFYCGIHQLPPAATLTLRRDRCTLNTYWPPPTSADQTTSTPASRTRDLLSTAVRRQLVADVPVGCLLSGGVDSSVIAAAMKSAAAPGQDVHTFSIGFDDPRYDESQYARRVADHLGTRHHAFTVRPDAAELLPRLAAAFGEPFADSSALPTYYLARETRQHVKVALSGDGGDELFGGYDRYRAIELSTRLARMVPAFAARRLGRYRRGHPKSSLARAGRFFNSLALPLARRYASYLRLFDDHAIDKLLGRPATAHFADPVEQRFAELYASGLDPARAACAVDRATYLPHDLLTKVDRCSMLHALEVRSPFMDHHVVAFAATLTTAQLLKGGPKRMLREAFAADLPAWVFRRKKMGFAVPIGDWFRAALRPMLRDHLFAADGFATTHFQRPVLLRLVDDHESKRADHSQRLYALLMLELWWRRHKG